MSLTKLCQHFVETLSSTPPETWDGLVIPRDLAPKVILDPSILGEDQNKHLFISPQVFYPQMEETNRRGLKIQSVAVQYVITVGLCVPFTTSPDQQQVYHSDDTHDSAGSLPEEYAILDLWEKMTLYLIRNIPKEYDLISVEPEIPVEIELGLKKFLVITDFTLSRKVC